MRPKRQREQPRYVVFEDPRLVQISDLEDHWPGAWEGVTCFLCKKPATMFWVCNLPDGYPVPAKRWGAYPAQVTAMEELAEHFNSDLVLPICLEHRDAGEIPS